MLIFESQSMDVYRNLAIEEYLMEHAIDFGPVLFLWQSDCAVVMGKNQNPWKECRLGLMDREKVPLARRISGGGTVYHDTGNLNYCVMVDRRLYREQQAYEMVMRALASFGIRAEKSGRSNLSVNGLKFSGNAFCFRSGRAMHHGTLLLNADLDRLNRYLGSMFDKIETHAIASVPAKVMNLHLETQALMAALADGFEALYGDGDTRHWSEGDLDRVQLDQRVARQYSDEWRYGATPRFVLEHRGASIEVVRNIVVSAEGIPEAGQLVKKHFSEIAFSLVC